MAFFFVCLFETLGSKLVVQLVVLGQVDPAEDEGGEGQREQHDEHG